MRKTILLTFCLSCITLLLWREITLLPDGKLHVSLLDVGQGDSILIVTPSGKQIIIDGGPNEMLLSHLSRMLPFFDRTIELLVISHPDADHITAIPAVLRRYSVNAILMTGADHSSGSYDALRAIALEKHIPILFPDPHSDIHIGDGVVLDIIWPDIHAMPKWPEYASNDLSIVIRLLYKDHSLLFTGDIEAKTEATILKSGADIRADTIKIPHHGSHTSSSSGFLLSVAPIGALLSVGRENKFGHPHADILERYRSFSIPIRSTADEGVISLVLD